MFNQLIFNSKTFPLRLVDLEDLGLVTISTTRLQDMLLSSDERDLISTAAQVIDEKIYYYVTEQQITLPEVKLHDLLTEEVV